MAIDSTSSTTGTSQTSGSTGKYQTATNEQGNAQFFSDLVNSSRVESQETDSLTQAGLSTEAGESKATEDQFLTLLLAQMNNQDPLNPLDNAQVTSQLAQISTVSGIEEMNSTMEALLNKINSSSPVDSASMIERQILVSGDTLSLSDELSEEVNAGAELSTSATSVNIEIFDGQGDSVRSIALGSQAAGLVTFQWDGMSDDGESLPAADYRFQVSAESDSGIQIAEPMIAAKVTGVTQSDGGLSYRLANGSIVLSDQVRGVF